MTANSVKISVDVNLLEKAKKKFPATKGMTWTGLTEYLKRKALECDS